MRQDAVLLDERSAEEFFLFLKEKSRTAGTIENYRHSLEELYDYLPEADGGSGKIHRQRDAGTMAGRSAAAGLRRADGQRPDVGRQQVSGIPQPAGPSGGAHVGGTGRNSAGAVPGGISADC